MVRQHGRHRHTPNTVITFTSDNKIQYMTLPVSAPLHVLNGLDIEISTDQQMSIAGGKRVNKLREFSEETSSF